MNPKLKLYLRMVDVVWFAEVEGLREEADRIRDLLDDLYWSLTETDKEYLNDNLKILSSMPKDEYSNYFLKMVLEPEGKSISPNQGS